MQRARERRAAAWQSRHRRHQPTHRARMWSTRHRQRRRAHRARTVHGGRRHNRRGVYVQANREDRRGARVVAAKNSPGHTAANTTDTPTHPLSRRDRVAGTAISPGLPMDRRCHCRCRCRWPDPPQPAPKTSARRHRQFSCHQPRSWHARYLPDAGRAVEARPRRGSRAGPRDPHPTSPPPPLPNQQIHPTHRQRRGKNVRRRRGEQRGTRRTGHAGGG